MPVFGTVRYEENGKEYMAVHCPDRLTYNEAVKRGEKWVEATPGADRGVTASRVSEKVLKGHEGALLK